jgi:hypothetical protein
MKQLTAVMSVVAFATTAFGSSLNMNFVVAPGDVSDPQGGTSIGDSIILGPSDDAYFALWLHLDASEELYAYGYEFDTNPPVADMFTWNSFQPGPHIYVDQAPGGQLNEWAATGFYYYYPYYTYPHGPVDVLIALFGIHGTGVTGQTYIYYDVYTVLDFVDLDNKGLRLDTSDAAAGIAVYHSNPEPASLALLALGALALIRRP